MRSSFIDSVDFIFWTGILLASLVLISPLGIMPLLDDEPIRALVSLEMTLSGNYWVPTTNGELYQNKPPLFNWLIAGLMNTSPDFSEFHLRLPPILVLISMTISIYCLFKKEIGEKAAMYTAFAFLTCGRILFVDSMLGYIDPFFSLAIFLNLFFLYKLDVKTRPWSYFLLSYLFCLIAFMLKGLPALVFQAISLPAALYLKDSFKKLYSLQHLMGIGVFVVGLASYYLVYAMYFPVDSLFATLWEQSSKRTLTSVSTWDGFLFILGFPFEFVMHFLPWTLLVLFCFRKDIVRIVRQNQFVKYSAVIFVANIWVYWLSPETRPRYLFMFLPFYFAILFYVYVNYATDKQKKITHAVMLGLGGLLLLGSTVPLFLPSLDFVGHRFVKAVVVSVSLLALIWIMWRKPVASILAFVAVLLVVRLGFNFFVLPSRKLEAPESLYKKFGTEIGRLCRSTPVYLLDDTLLDNDISYYISSVTKHIVRRHAGLVEEGAYYICRQEHLSKYGLKTSYRFFTNFQKVELHLAKK